MSSHDPQLILSYLQNYQPEMVAQLARIVEMESPSGNKPALDRLSAYLAGELVGLGLQTETLEQEEGGNHVLARWGTGTGGTLILCHMDTVWDIGTILDRPVRQEDGRLYGPGAMDMKGGIVVALWALRALRDLGVDPARRVTLLLSSDEETGSHSSRAIIEREALAHERVFVLEPAQPPNGMLKTWRKGVGGFWLRVSGRAAHAGAAHELGVNAIDELARQILRIREFTDYQRGTTVNVGVVHGGTRSNVVPAEAWAEVDVRVMTMEEAGRISALMETLSVVNPEAELSVKGGFNRPPMERTPAIAELFSQARALGVELGLQLEEGGTGGASDGNFTAALGVPTLDGLGVVGNNAHALEEYALISSLPERAALLAGLLVDAGRSGQSNHAD